MFPSITICNLNQVTATSIKHIFPHLVKMDHRINVLIDEFISGRDNNLTEKEEKIVENIQKKVNANKGSFRKISGQHCTSLFISMSFRGTNLKWNQIKGHWNQPGDLGPMYYPTDFGSCCLLVPHLHFQA